MKTILKLTLIALLSGLTLTPTLEAVGQQRRANKKQTDAQARKLRRTINAQADQSGKYGVQNKASQTALTPDKALARLKEGNHRFVENHPVNQKNYRQQVPIVAKGQYPFAAILSCIDSRSSVEDIFDLNNGDSFNARVAGNVVNDDIIGSLEFATKVINAKLIVVMGHTHCGAIYGACDSVKLGSLTGLLDKVEPAIQTVMATGKARDSKNEHFLDEVTKENVRVAMRQMTEKSPIMKELVDTGKLKIVGALYHLETGHVEFFE